MGLMLSPLHSVLGFALICACSPTTGAGPTSESAKSPVASATTAPSTSAWPCYRGAKGDGISTLTGFNRNWASQPPKLLWQAALTDDGFAGPSSANGILYVVDHQGGDDIVRAWNLVNGQEIWHYTYPDATSSNYGFSRATPTIDGENVYVVSRLGKVICLTAKAGKPVWQRDMVAEMGGQRPGWDYAGSPVVDGNRLVVTPGANDGAVVALNKATGETLLKGGSGAPGYATPVVATIQGKKQYVLFQAKKVAGISAADGKQLWSVPWETSYDVNAANPIVIGNSVYISSGYGHGCALIDVGPGGAAIRWQNRAIQAQFATALLYNGKIYGTGDPGILVCLDPATGNTLWKQPGFEKGGMIAADGVAFVHNGSNGELVMVKLDPSGYHELGRIAPLHGQAWTAPILVDGKLVVRNKEAIAVVDLG